MGGRGEMGGMEEWRKMGGGDGGNGDALTKQCGKCRNNFKIGG